MNTWNVELSEKLDNGVEKVCRVWWKEEGISLFTERRKHVDDRFV